MLRLHPHPRCSHDSRIHLLHSLSCFSRMGGCVQVPDIDFNQTSHSTWQSQRHCPSGSATVTPYHEQRGSYEYFATDLERRNTLRRFFRFGFPTYEL